MTTLDPYGKWPRHKVGAWNVTYEEAKGRGWRLEEHSNHSTKYLVCPTGECRLGPIFSTARGTESVAEDYLKDVRRCPHAEADQATRVQRTKGHLRNGEMFAGAARRQIEAAARRDHIEELWVEADRQADAADDLLHSRDDDAIEADLQESDWWAAHYEEKAQEVLADTPLAGVTEPSAVVAAADDAADDAEEALAEVSGRHDERPALEARLGALRAVNEDLRLRIDGLPTDT